MPFLAVVVLAPLLAGATEPASAPDAAHGRAAVSIPAPVGLEKKLVDDAKDGKLDGIGLLEGALVASGVKDTDVPAEAARVRKALALAIAKAKAQKSAHNCGDVLLHALHDTVLRSYVSTA